MGKGTEARHRELAQLCQQGSPAFAHWARGYGVIEHSATTQVRVSEMALVLVRRGQAASADAVYELLAHVDRVANAAMWLVVHATYADRVYSDGRPLEASDFKKKPEGHTGGALNMAPAYVGYLAANALTGTTRSWMMGQGHCVSAIDAANLLVDNMTPAHAERYSRTDEGMTRFVRDYYSYRMNSDGSPESPLGSHVNVHTAGGMIEGGYLGFAELLWVHAPMPGERLVTFLSDGAFEEQRGSDWAPRWWRASDTGLVCPIMIANGRRIDQRTTLAQQGGTQWLQDHLRLNGFDPLEIDGRDPSAFVWAIFEMEERLRFRGEAAERGESQYPVRIPYAIAETVKGFGFEGAGTNPAHNLPLPGSPFESDRARALFHRGAARLHVPTADLEAGVSALRRGVGVERPAEREHSMVTREAPRVDLPSPMWQTSSDAPRAVMEALDALFVQLVKANPGLRVRIGNPDELSSNRMNRTLDLLRHRVCCPEDGVAESIRGGVITALNEESVVCAALANKGGLNLVVTYEAFGVKMLGALRQEIIFARQQKRLNRGPHWLSVPVVLTSHTWENGKNEQSHQDPSLAESLLSEMSDVSRVFFPVDANTAAACLRATYQTQCQIHAHVVPKGALPFRFDAEACRQLLDSGAYLLRRDPGSTLSIVACGSYQLQQAERASERLTQRGVPHSVLVILEPGRFREARDDQERGSLTDEPTRKVLFPASETQRVFLVHTRPEIFLGTVRPLDTGPGRTVCLGYVNRGGTLDTHGMMFTNRCSWAHALHHVARLRGIDPGGLLEVRELAAVEGVGDPEHVR